MAYGRLFTAIATIGAIFMSGAAAAQDWKTTGNSTTATNFLGTINNEPLIVKTDNKERLRILSNGNVGIHATDPTATLAVDGTYAESASPSSGVPVMKLTSGNIEAALQAQNGEAGQNVIEAFDDSKAGVGVLAVSKHGIGVEANLNGGNDSAKKGAAGLSAVQALDFSPSGSYTYGIYAVSDANIAVFGESIHNISAYFEFGNSGGEYCEYAGSSGWNCAYPAAARKHAAAADPRAVLEKLTALPEWRYQLKGETDGAWYLGPTGEDFKAAFDLGGGDSTMIDDANLHGVALTAIAGLDRKLIDDEAKIAALTADNAAMKQTLAEEKNEMASLRAAVDRLARNRPALAVADLTDR